MNYRNLDSTLAVLQSVLVVAGKHILEVVAAHNADLLEHHRH